MLSPSFQAPALLIILAVAIHANGAAPTSKSTSADQSATTSDAGAVGSIRKSSTAMDIIGEWTAEVECGSGAFDFRISLGPLAGGPQLVGGMVMLKPKPGSKASPGSYSIKGELQNGELRLRDGSWMQKSKNIPMLSLDATVYANPDRIAGRAVEASCSKVDLRRPGLLFAATTPALQNAADQANPDSMKPPLTYRAVTKIIGDAKGNNRLIVANLVGKAVNLKLKATGPQALVVDPKDGVFFVCASRSQAFRSGDVTAKIAAYETTPDGDSSISLDRCGK